MRTPGGREGMAAAAAAAGIVSFYIPGQSGAAICDFLASYDTGVLVSPCESTQHMRSSARCLYRIRTRPLLLIYWCLLVCVNVGVVMR